jgi:ABC-2 type transport system ATP-binding protein
MRYSVGHEPPSPAHPASHQTLRRGQRAARRGPELRAGECFGLVGVNGAGKTSLIKCLLDFCALDGGSIEIFGQPHHRPAARAAGFLPERFTRPTT